MENHGNTSSLKLIRLTGVLYLLVIICAGFAQGIVRETIIVPDDAYATAKSQFQ